MNPQQTMYDPQWTTVVYIPGGSRDALGIETLSEAILADLLPGINNQTRRARYYSFWAWALHGFIHDPAAIHTQKGFYKWSRGREDTLILAQIAHGCSGAAAGCPACTADSAAGRSAADSAAGRSAADSAADAGGPTPHRW